MRRQAEAIGGVRGAAKCCCLSRLITRGVMAESSNALPISTRSQRKTMLEISRRFRLRLYRKLVRLFESLSWYFERRADGLDVELHGTAEYTQNSKW